jgi:hypothetical protein
MGFGRAKSGGKMTSIRIQRIVAAFFFVDSLAVLAIWAGNLAGGAFPNGLLARQQEVSIPLLHLVAEFLMAGVTLAGVVGLWQGRRWGTSLTLVGMGMFAYAALNSLGWAIVNDPVQGLPMALTLLAAAAAVPLLSRSHS